jgi:hypothetical protein
MGFSLTDAGSLQVSFIAGPAGPAYSVAHACSWAGVSVTFVNMLAHNLPQ